MRSVLFPMLATAFLFGPAYAGNETTPPPAPPVSENTPPDGTVTLKGGSVAAGIGYTWGHGDLEYHDSSHRFTIKGVSVVAVGATEFTAKGHVYNLKNLSDFAGNYVAAAAGVTLAGGVTATYLKNEHGVIMKLFATDIGLKFDLSADGVHVALKN